MGTRERAPSPSGLCMGQRVARVESGGRSHDPPPQAAWRPQEGHPEHAVGCGGKHSQGAEAVVSGAGLEG